MKKSLPESLRDNVRLLGELLGDTVMEDQGPALFRRIEQIRTLSKELALQGEENPDQVDYQPLVKVLEKLPDREVLPVARAFNQFLNLANIADMQHFSGSEDSGGQRLGQVLEELAGEKGKDAIREMLEQLRIELVLTAHPTEVTRRTLIHKYEKVANALSSLNRRNLPDYQLTQTHEHLKRVVSEIWHTDEIRESRPTAVDEAKWGFAVIENSLWQALAVYLRHLDNLCLEYLGSPLPPDFQPFRFYSWMGGDRDGNPNVTHGITEEVILLGRWKAAELYLQDLWQVGDDLSMHAVSSELLEALPSPSKTPYRDLLHRLRARLQLTMRWTEDCLRSGRQPPPDGVITSSQELLDPLMLCYDSLNSVGLPLSARGPLLDLIRKVHAFGINLLPLDIRQHSERHATLLAEITRYLELGDYSEWEESRRMDFLLEQLAGKRPLIPRECPLSADSAEVLATCRTMAEQPHETLSHYVISMATQPSDVLAVALLLRECGLKWPMPIVPLFETLDDLERAPQVMTTLWSLPWYRQYIDGNQTVMIGYSDSAKDAGKFAATWAQYTCQEKLVELAAQEGIQLKLFHGRGGTIGRGGGPVEKAIASQPPGSISGSFRVTEQGEMIRYKFGMPGIAFNSLGNYVQSILRASVLPEPAPRAEWRQLMEKMSAASLEGYRGIVHGHPAFVPYFRALTPEQELNRLAIGSRPAKRKADGGIESLRAIPWVFAWTQVRLNLPGWLGIRQALQLGLDSEPELLKDMIRNWSFFSSFLDLIEMVLDKCDITICAHYESQLVSPDQHELGQALRDDLGALVELVNSLKGQEDLLQGNSLLQQSVNVRKPYIAPLNYLQAELLKRERRSGVIAPDLERALLVSMSGIAAGMRNTG